MSDKNQIRYIDVRSFGRFWYLTDGESISVTGMDKLGKRKKAIKEMLLDQSIIVGIGNIYSDEILYASRIYPEKPCNILTDDEWQRLALQIPKIIGWAIKANEITSEEYLGGKGKEYRNTSYLKVYGHEGKL